MLGRDLVGHGPHPPHPQWPGGARLALQFVLNIEEGGEATPVNGDATSEGYLHELPGRPIRQGERDLSVCYRLPGTASGW
jgi:allantoinase